MRKKQKLGEILLDLNIIKEEDLNDALKNQEISGDRLGSILLKMNALSEEDLENLLSRQLNVPSINLENYPSSEEILALIDEDIIKRYKVLPIGIQGKTLTIATANPNDLNLLDDLAYTTGYKIVPVVTSISSIENKIHDLFKKSPDWEDALKIDKDSDLEIIKQDKDMMEEDLEKALQSAEEALVVKLVNAIILAAIKKEATHIHIEPKEDFFEIRIRVDSKLSILVKPPASLHQNVVNRLKILGSIDVLKRFLPNEGYFRARSEGEHYDIDITTMPSLHGERMVLTFQQPFSKEELKLEKLGFTPELLSEFKKMLTNPRGFILVTGPSDSGKSSTIYAALNHIKQTDKAIFTYERTVKNKLIGINQGQPNEKAGFKYEKGLQALLRQDIDTLMVGDLMTREAVELSLLASLSKTLVLGRFLSNDTIGSIEMLLDLGVPPFMLFSTLTGIIGQRLVRRLCQECIEDYEPPEELGKQIQQVTAASSPRLFRSSGCPACGHTGYNNRIGLFEILIPTAELRDAIFAKAPLNELKKAAGTSTHLSFLQDGLIKASEGLTSYEEVVRAI